MPPFSGNETGGRLTAYADHLDGGMAVKLSKGPEFGVEDFKPMKPLGNGDMGNVYLVAHRSTNAPYAMKVMRKDVLKARKNAHRALNERDILASVNHPFLPVLHSHFETEKHMFLVMDYCHAGDLNVLRQQQPERRFSESACRFYIAETVLALEYLHKRKIVYRDLKPENILIQSGGHVMLTDFDLSLDLSNTKFVKSPSVKPSTESPKDSSPRKLKKKLSWRVNHVKAFFACGGPVATGKPTARKNSKNSPQSRVTPEELYANRKGGSGIKGGGPAHSFVGTEEYVAPEIIWSRGHGLPVDWWTVGILLYELYYGKTPFKGLNRKETFYNVLCKPVEYPGPPSPLTDLIRKLLVKEPEQRLGTKGGAEAIKNHPFFEGVIWEDFHYLSRTPVVPEPFSWEQIEKERLERAAKAKAAGKVVQSNWSFDGNVDSLTNENVPKSPTGPLSLKSNGSSVQNRSEDDFVSRRFVGKSSTVSTPRNSSLELAPSDVFDVQRQSGRNLQPTNIIRKEEVRLDDEDVVDHKLFADVF